MFTDLKIKGLKPKKNSYRVYEKASDAGFCVQVLPSNKKVFVLVYSFAEKKQRVFNLGTYSTVFGVKEARERCRRARALLDEGIDPQADKQRRQEEQKLELQKKEEDSNAVTVNDVLDLYLTTLVTPGTHKSVKQQFMSDVRPLIGDIKARVLSEEKAEVVITNVLDRGSNTSARNLYIYLHAAFNQAIKKRQFNLRGWVNPLDYVDKPPKNPPNDRALSSDEIMILWRALNKSRMSQGMIDILRLLLLTGQRVQEITELRWDEVDLKEKYIDLPVERIKTRKKVKVGQKTASPGLIPKAIKLS